jgi:hypothetical protein
MDSVLSARGIGGVMLQSAGYDQPLTLSGSIGPKKMFQAQAV